MLDGGGPKMRNICVTSFMDGPMVAGAVMTSTAAADGFFLLLWEEKRLETWPVSSLPRGVGC